jgi:hypothetical protein
MFAAVGPWSDNYINGYFNWGNASLLAGDPTPPKGTSPKAVSFTGYGHNMTLAQLHRLMDPFVKKMNATHGLTGTFNTTYLPRVTCILSTSSGEGSAAGAGYNVAMGSRLWPKESLTNRTGLLSVFKTLDLNINQALMISGPAVRDKSATKFTSVSPAWRKSYVHICKFAPSDISPKMPLTSPSDHCFLGLPQCCTRSDDQRSLNQCPREIAPRPRPRQRCLSQRSRCQ